MEFEETVFCSKGVVQLFFKIIIVKDCMSGFWTLAGVFIFEHLSYNICSASACIGVLLANAVRISIAARPTRTAHSVRDSRAARTAHGGPVPDCMRQYDWRGRDAPQVERLEAFFGQTPRVDPSDCVGLSA